MIQARRFLPDAHTLLRQSVRQGADRDIGEAEALGVVEQVPVQRLDDQGLLQLGYGARQRRVLAPQTDRTGALAESIARDHELTRTLLRSAGVPVPEPEWGIMVAIGAEDLVTGHWWPSVFPGVAMGLTVLGFALVGEFLGQVIDPLKRR